MAEKRSNLLPMELPQACQPTGRALAECCRAMRYLVDEIGWRENNIPELEKLWWTVRDERGNVREVSRG